MAGQMTPVLTPAAADGDTMRSRTTRGVRAAGLALVLVCSGTACSVIPTGASRAVAVEDVGRETRSTRRTPA
nr:hypothetical protein GCM10020093_093190 [Planobispora longispora]